MKTITFLPFAVSVAALALSGRGALAQDFKASKSLSNAGETLVRVEGTLRKPPREVWKWFSTEEGLKCWVAPLVKLDLRIGGKLQSNYDAKSSIGAAGTITLGITNYVDAELITFKVSLNDSFSELLQAEDGNLQEVIRLDTLPNGGTRVISTMVGWGIGPEWDRAADFFVKGNAYSYKILAQCVDGTVAK